eukprot:13826194-Alexandrium_andersonii.AAC.1
MAPFGSFGDNFEAAQARTYLCGSASSPLSCSPSRWAPPHPTSRRMASRSRSWAWAPCQHPR